ncbi:hypothetical protein V2G26_004391 [Clonostachys chloroleuca]
MSDSDLLARYQQYPIPDAPKVEGGELRLLNSSAKPYWLTESHDWKFRIAIGGSAAGVSDTDQRLQR